MTSQKQQIFFMVKTASSQPIQVIEVLTKKIRTLQNYYKNFDRKNGSMQVLVEKESIQVLCILVCVDLYSDCTQKENSDPNNWGQKSPRQITDLVVLCDGQGEMSPTPFKGSIRP